MRGRRGLTLLEALLGAVVVVAALVFAVVAVRRSVEESRRHSCANNLNQLAKGMAVYLSAQHYETYLSCPLGRGRNPKEYNGAEWLASLYWTGAIPDPGVFLCPGSGDTNDDGIHIGSTRTTPSFGSQTVSYAGLHWRSLTATGSVIRYDYPPNQVMASDDTQGTINHDGAYVRGMNVLFFDGYVKFKSADQLDPETIVGQKGGLLNSLQRMRAVASGSAVYSYAVATKPSIWYKPRNSVEVGSLGSIRRARRGI